MDLVATFTHAELVDAVKLLAEKKGLSVKGPITFKVENPNGKSDGHGGGPDYSASARVEQIEPKQQGKQHGNPQR